MIFSLLKGKNASMNFTEIKNHWKLKNENNEQRK